MRVVLAQRRGFCDGVVRASDIVERALEKMRIEIERGMKLMGCSSIEQLSRKNLRFR